MNENEYENKNNERGSFFVIAQIIASLIIVCGVYALKNTNPKAYTEVKDWYNFNISSKALNTTYLKEKTQEFSGKASDCISTCILEIRRCVTS